MAGSKQFAYIDGLSDLQKFLKPIDETVAEPWRSAMTALGQEGQAHAQSLAPYRTGFLRSKIHYRVQNKPMPMWVAVRVRAKHRSKKYPKGYDYPRLLEFSGKHGHKGWFYDRLGPFLQNRAEELLAKAGDEIAEKWEG